MYINETISVKLKNPLRTYYLHKFEAIAKSAISLCRLQFFSSEIEKKTLQTLRIQSNKILIYIDCIYFYFY